MDNPDVKTLFIEDQTDRGNDPFSKSGSPQPKPLSGLQVRKNDNAREDKVKALLDAGSLHTGTDFFRAALIFQHSDKPDGQLFAHTLAVIAVAKGNADALWLSAATLDRYLVTSGKPQLFGTQFSAKPQPAHGYMWQHDPVSPLLNDALRADFCVVPLSQQIAGLPKQISSTSLSPCPAAKTMHRSSETTDTSK